MRGFYHMGEILKTTRYRDLRTVLAPPFANPAVEVVISLIFELPASLKA